MWLPAPTRVGARSDVPDSHDAVDVPQFREPYVCWRTKPPLRAFFRELRVGADIGPRMIYIGCCAHFCNRQSRCTVGRMTALGTFLPVDGLMANVRFSSATRRGPESGLL